MLLTNSLPFSLMFQEKMFKKKKKVQRKAISNPSRNDIARTKSNLEKFCLFFQKTFLRKSFCSIFQKFWKYCNNKHHYKFLMNLNKSCIRTSQMEVFQKTGFSSPLSWVFQQTLVFQVLLENVLHLLLLCQDYSHLA